MAKENTKEIMVNLLGSPQSTLDALPLRARTRETFLLDIGPPTQQGAYQSLEIRSEVMY